MNEYQKSDLDELEYFTEERKQAFEINDLESLTWAFKKLASINAELKEKEDVASAERFKIDEWLKRSSESLKHSKDFFEYHIKVYHEKELANNPSKKSISTPYGKIKSTTTKEQPSISNTEDLVWYLQQNKLPHFSLVPKIDWSELKKTLKVKEIKEEVMLIDDDLDYIGTDIIINYVVVDEFGQIVPGVEVKPKNTTFKIEGV